VTPNLGPRPLSWPAAFLPAEILPIKPRPTTMGDWIAEIRAAPEDHAGRTAGRVDIKPEDLFHLAPSVALKFRGLA